MIEPFLGYVTGRYSIDVRIVRASSRRAVYIATFQLPGSAIYTERFQAPSHRDRAEFAHNPFQDIFVILEQDIELLVLVGQSLVFQDEVRCEFLELR